MTTTTELSKAILDTCAALLALEAAINKSASDRVKREIKVHLPDDNEDLTSDVE